MPRYWPVVLALLAGAGALAVGLHTQIGGTDHWAAASRFTARVGFPFFILAYAASSLARLWPNAATRGLMRGRKYWGLAFATTHTFHLYALLNFMAAMPEEPEWLYLSPAILAYILLYAMALTSWGWAYKAMGKWWKRLHSFGIHYLWLIFAAAYSLRILQEDQRIVGASFAAIAFAALGLRIIAWRRKRAKRAAA